MTKKKTIVGALEARGIAPGKESVKVKGRFYPAADRCRQHIHALRVGLKTIVELDRRGMVRFVSQELPPLKMNEKFMDGIEGGQKIATTRLDFKGLGFFRLVKPDGSPYGELPLDHEKLHVRIYDAMVWRECELSDVDKRTIAASENYRFFEDFWGELCGIYPDADSETTFVTHFFERACAGCQCTDSMACDGGCSWVKPSWCSKCEMQAKRSG